MSTIERTAIYIECFHVTSRHGRHVGVLKETAAMLVSPTNPPGFELYSYANAFFCFALKTCSLIT